MPNAAARPVIVPATAFSTRIVVANPLFSHTKTTGIRQSAARFNDSSSTPWLTAPSPKKFTATRSPPSCRSAHAAPVAIGAAAPTMAFAPRMPRLKSAACMEPPRPRFRPVARPASSASIRAGSAPLARTCPCPRWVLVMTSPSRSAAQNPAAIAS